MVLPEVSKDPPSPFLTVQSTCDGALLPVPPPPEQPCPSPGSDSSSRSWHTAQSCSSQTNGQAVGPPATQRTHLQSIVSQQSLNFNIPPDSPFEFEQALNSIAAASAVAESQNGKQHQAAAAAGHSDFTAQMSAHDPSQDAASNRHKGLRFLGGSWLRPTQSVPHCAVSQKRQHPSALPQPAMPQLSFGHSGLLDKAYSQEPQPAHQQHILGKKLKTRVHKLLAWASGRAPASPDAMSPQLMSAPLGHFGSLTFTPTGAVSHQQQQQQQQQGVPVAWQHQVFSEPSVQLINTTPGTPPPLRSPRSSLVSSPSSCDCPLLGRYSSTGSDSGYGRSPGLMATCSSQGCSLTTTPSPGKAAGASVIGSSLNGCVVGTPSGPEAALLKVTASVRTAHHRHRQHRPGCKFHPQYQQQQAAAGGHMQPPHMQQLPSSPSMGGLMPQSSLRTALQQLESMASIKAARIMDKLNAGLQKVTSHRVFDGVLRQGTVGKEVMRDWELGPALGVGASCVTRLVTEKTSGRTAACKSISKQGILHSAVVKAALLAVQREVAILQAVVGHPHVVALHAVYEDINNLHMIMDWCGGGSLWQLMERCPGYMLPEAAAAAATKAVLEVLAHCHARGVMHRDIKPDNLLVAKPLVDPHQLTADDIKVTDFGISVPFTPGQVLTELAGTMGYMAPEVLRRSYNEQADVWSTGVMLYEMICGQLPFNLGNTCEECLANIEEAELDLSCPAWQAASADAHKLVSTMLAKDPQLRPTAQQLLDTYSSWLQRGLSLQQ